MQFMDTHIHLQDFKCNDTLNIIKARQNLGIGKFVCVSAQEADWVQIAQIYEQFSDTVIPAFGLHPWYADKGADGWAHQLEYLLQKYPQALVGEVGLDKFKNPQPAAQKQAFAIQIELAKKYQRPLLIHAVQAAGWLEEFWDKLPQKFVFHAFNSKISLLKKILEKGGYISFSSSILRHPNRKKLVSLVPKDKLLLETDAPFQSMDSDTLPQIATAIAKLRGEDLQEMTSQVYQNSLEFTNDK